MAAHEMLGHEPDEIRNLRIPAKHIRRVREKATTLPLAQRLRMPGLEPRRADLVVAGSVLLDTILRQLGAEDITLCDLALREGLVLDYVHRNRTEIARADRYPGRAPPKRGRAGGTLPLLARTRQPDLTPLAGPVRPDARRARSHGPRTPVAGLRRAAARYRRPYQLRKTPPALVLPDQARRPARLRSAGNRGAGAHRTLPPPRDAQERPPRLHRFATSPSQDRQGAGRLPEAGRGPRPQPRAGASTRSAFTTAGASTCCSCTPRATPSSSCGPRAATPRRSRIWWARPSASRSRRARGKKAPAAATTAADAPR